MIAHLRGRLLRKETQEAVVDVGGVGYRVSIPALDLLQAGRRRRSRSRLLVHTHVREDALTLFGFLTADEQAALRAPDRRVRRRSQAGDQHPVGHRSARARRGPARQRRRPPDPYSRRRQEDGRAARPGAQGQAAPASAGGRSPRRPPPRACKEDLLSALANLGYSRPEAEQRRRPRAARRRATARFEDLLRRSLRILSGR